ncbi:hypothetical protein DOJK_00462 [Patescibacteria group bacterium]|nr:hypothetical protein DOJK_00462 [Patescibacteria group bacterium]
MRSLFDTPTIEYCEKAIKGIIARNLDLYGVICDSSNLLNGRAVLHYVSTISIMLLFLYYNKVIYKRK